GGAASGRAIVAGPGGLSSVVNYWSCEQERATATRGGPMHTFVDPLYRAQKLFANHVAIVNGDIRLTYAETWSRCRRLAGALTPARGSAGRACGHSGVEQPSVPRSLHGGAGVGTRRSAAEYAPCRVRTAL